MSVLFFRAAVCKIDPAVAFLCRIFIYHQLCVKCIVRSSIFQITPISFNILFHSIHTKVNKYVPKKPAIMTIRPQVLLFSLANYHIPRIMFSNLLPSKYSLRLISYSLKALCDVVFYHGLLAFDRGNYLSFCIEPFFFTWRAVFAFC